MLRQWGRGGGSITLVQEKEDLPEETEEVWPEADEQAETRPPQVEVKPRPRRKLRPFREGDPDATDVDGWYHLLSTTEVDAGCAVFVVHAARGRPLNVTSGDTLHVISRHDMGQLAMTVAFVGRDRYTRPGNKQSYCRVGVPLEQCGLLPTGYT